MSSNLPTQNRDIELSSIAINTDPASYIASEELIQAVEIAIALNKPLVVSGEPGTGKTQLAHWVAEQLSVQTEQSAAPFVGKTIVFDTKSGSASTDLFYYYDAVGHFRNQQDRDVAEFIDLRAMGLAIALAHGKKSDAISGLLKLNQFRTVGERNAKANKNIFEIQDHPQSSVVLIDEIDKAPRDFPNDLLNEMENYSFSIRELGLQIPRPTTNARIIVIMTSNSEKNLPNAFLRRCVFYHIPFPKKDKLLEITKSRMRINDNSYNESLEKAIDLFREYREEAVNKKPATSEFLDWVYVLKKFHLLNNGELGKYNGNQEKQKTNFLSSLNVLFKSKEDMSRATEKIKKNSIS